MASVNYTLPSWLQTSPEDTAKNFVSGLQIGATLGEARNRLQQQANQSAVENQLQQDKLTASAMQQTQELQVKKSYEDQQVSLATQKLDAAKQKIGLETMKAARQFQAQQSYQKDYQDALDSGLSEDEAAKGAMFKNLGMFSSGTGAMNAVSRGRASVPQTTVVYDSSGRPHTMATLPGSGVLQDLDRSSGTTDWQSRHDITRREKVQDMQLSDLKTQRKALQKSVTDAEEAKWNQPTANAGYQKIYQDRVSSLSKVNQDIQALMRGGAAAPAPSEPVDTGADESLDAETQQTAPATAPIKVTAVRVKAPAASATSTSIGPSTAPVGTSAAFMGQGVLPSSGVTAPSIAVPEASKPAAQPTPQIDKYRLTKWHVDDPLMPVDMTAQVNSRNVPNLSTRAVAELAKQLGVAPKGLEYDNGKLYTYKKGQWGTSDVSEKKLRKEVLQAANDQQYYVEGQ